METFFRSLLNNDLDTDIIYANHLLFYTELCEPKADGIQVFSKSTLSWFRHILQYQVNIHAESKSKLPNLAIRPYWKFRHVKEIRYMDLNQFVSTLKGLHFLLFSDVRVAVEDVEACWSVLNELRHRVAWFIQTHGQVEESEYAILLESMNVEEYVTNRWFNTAFMFDMDAYFSSIDLLRFYSGRPYVHVNVTFKDTRFLRSYIEKEQSEEFFVKEFKKFLYRVMSNSALRRIFYRKLPYQSMAAITDNSIILDALPDIESFTTRKEAEELYPGLVFDYMFYMYTLIKLFNETDGGRLEEIVSWQAYILDFGRMDKIMWNPLRRAWVYFDDTGRVFETSSFAGIYTLRLECKKLPTDSIRVVFQDVEIQGYN